MTTPDQTFPDNYGLKEGGREALRQLMNGTAREALRRYTMHPTSIGYDGAIEGAVGWQMSNIDAGGGIDLLPFIRENCAHMWIFTDRHVCADCGEIGPDS